jgi:hypothetical protein
MNEKGCLGVVERDECLCLVTGEAGQGWHQASGYSSPGTLQAFRESPDLSVENL